MIVKPSKFVFYICGGILYFLSVLNCSASCIDIGNPDKVDFDLNVRSCKEIIIKESYRYRYRVGSLENEPPLDAPYIMAILGIKDDSKTRQVKGLLLSGVITSGNDTEIELHKLKIPFKKGTVTTVFLLSQDINKCPERLPELFRLRWQSNCCDVLPHDGACLVPGNMPVVEWLELQKR